jgi:hypothetical protein
MRVYPIESGSASPRIMTMADFNLWVTLVRSPMLTNSVSSFVVADGTDCSPTIEMSCDINCYSYSC